MIMLRLLESRLIHSKIFVQKLSKLSIVLGAHARFSRPGPLLVMQGLCARTRKAPDTIIWLYIITNDVYQIIYHILIQYYTRIE